MKLLILLLISSVTYGQTTYFIQADSVRLRKVGATSNLIIESGTRAKTNAFLRNYNNGRTDFAYAVDSIWKMNDSTFIARRGDGNDTLLIQGSTPYTVSNGLTLASDNIKLGGTLVNNTLINSRGFSFRIDSSTLQNYGIYRAGDTSSATLSLRSTGAVPMKLSFDDAATPILTSTSSGLQIEWDGFGADVVLFAGTAVAPDALLRGQSEDNALIIESLTLRMPNLTNLSGQDRILGQVNSGGQVGNITIGSGLSLVAGDLSATGGGGFSVTNESNNRVITSVSAGVGNAEANMNFDGSLLSITGNVSATGMFKTGAYSGVDQKIYDNAGDMTISAYYASQFIAHANGIWKVGSVSASDLAGVFGNGTFYTNYTTILGQAGAGWNVGVGVGVPTSKLHIAPGAVGANTAPQKFSAGTDNSTPEAGAVEYDGARLSFTNSTAVRGTAAVVRTVVDAAATLTLAITYTHYVFSGITTTWTLPAVSGTTNHVFLIKNRGSGSITLNTAAAANDIYSTSAVNTLTITAGSSIILISDGTYFLLE